MSNATRAPTFGTTVAGSPSTPTTSNFAAFSADSSPSGSTSTAPLLQQPYISNAPPSVLAPSDTSSFTAALVQHLQNAFVTTEYSDLHLRVSFMGRHDVTSAFSLHSVIASQSPVLRSICNSTSPGGSVNLQFPPLCDSNSVSHVLAILYNPAPEFLHHIVDSNALSILATADFLLLPQLAAFAAAVCSRAIARLTTGAEFSEWFAALEIIEPSPPVTSVEGGYENAGPSGKAEGKLVNGAGPNGPVYTSGQGLRAYAAKFKGELLERLVTSLPAELRTFSPATAGSLAALVEVYRVVPFDVLKAVVESPALPFVQDLDRFNFGKRCLAERKKLTGARDFEENVVLGFGSSSPGTSNVRLIRKSRRPNLWKVHS